MWENIDKSVGSHQCAVLQWQFALHISKVRNNTAISPSPQALSRPFHLNFQAFNLGPYILIFLNWYSGGGGGSPIGSTRHCGYEYAYCASPGWLWWWRNWWIDDWQVKQKYSEKTYPSVTLSTTNPTCCLDANPGRRGGKPATNRLSYRTARPLC
jgi:hypothetical protein